MKFIKNYNGWGIFKNNADEAKEHGFEFTVLTPDKMDCYDYKSKNSHSHCPYQSIAKCNSLESALSWVENYG